MSGDKNTTTSELERLPDFAVIESGVHISRSADTAWAKIGNYGDAGKYLKVASQELSGSGEVGSVRIIGGSIIEVMVGKGQHSYTYTQTKGPMAAFSYHGCVSLEDAGEGKSTLKYTVTYDQSTMDSARRQAESERIGPRFQGMVEAMKTDAEMTKHKQPCCEGK